MIQFSYILENIIGIFLCDLITGFGNSVSETDLLNNFYYSFWADVADKKWWQILYFLYLDNPYRSVLLQFHYNKKFSFVIFEFSSELYYPRKTHLLWSYNKLSQNRSRINLWKAIFYTYISWFWRISNNSKLWRSSIELRNNVSKNWKEKIVSIVPGTWVIGWCDSHRIIHVHSKDVHLRKRTNIQLPVSLIGFFIEY